MAVKSALVNLDELSTSASSPERRAANAVSTAPDEPSTKAVRDDAIHFIVAMSQKSSPISYILRPAVCGKLCIQ